MLRKASVATATRSKLNASKCTSIALAFVLLGGSRVCTTLLRLLLANSPIIPRFMAYNFFHRPGEIVPIIGKYADVTRTGIRTGREVRCEKGDCLAPSPFPNHRYVFLYPMIRQTKNRPCWWRRRDLITIADVVFVDRAAARATSGPPDKYRLQQNAHRYQQGLLLGSSKPKALLRSRDRSLGNHLNLSTSPNRMGKFR